MNMKKAIAGVLASVVAISAMATTMVSAKNQIAPATTEQKAYTKTWDFTGTNYPVTWTGDALKNLGATYVQANDAADVITFTFNNPVDSASIKLVGEVTIGSINSTQEKTVNLKKVDATHYTLQLKATASTTTAGVFPVGYFNDGNVISTLSYTVSNGYAKKADADTAAKAPKNITVVASAANAAAGSLADVVVAGYSPATAIVGNEGKVGAVEKTHGPKISDTTVSTAGTLYLLNQITGDVFSDDNATDPYVQNEFEKGLSAVNFGSLMLAMQNEIGDAKGATLTFNLFTEKTADEGKTPDSIDDGKIAPLANSSSAENFSIALNYGASRKFTKGQKVASDATKITFNWDDLTQGLAAGTIFQSAVRVADGKTFQIDSVDVKVPAKTLAELSAGEAAAETTVALETTKAADAATTTEAAKNPTTGNAPIALAVIPVAIVAAAVVAKKRG